MARKKSGGPSKSQAIRTYMQDNSGASTSEIVAALAGQGIEVTPGLVSNIKYTSSKKKPGGRKGKVGRPPRSADDAVSVSALIEAKKLVNQVGSLELARKALDTLQRLS